MWIKFENIFFSPQWLLIHNEVEFSTVEMELFKHPPRRAHLTVRSGMYLLLTECLLVHHGELVFPVRERRLCTSSASQQHSTTWSYFWITTLLRITKRTTAMLLVSILCCELMILHLKNAKETKKAAASISMLCNYTIQQCIVPHFTHVKTTVVQHNMWWVVSEMSVFCLLQYAFIKAVGNIETEHRASCQVVGISVHSIRGPYVWLSQTSISFPTYILLYENIALQTISMPIIVNMLHALHRNFIQAWIKTSKSTSLFSPSVTLTTVPVPC